MMRSLWSAVSGLNTHQTEMDVIGNNISNVNTTSFKSQATGFKDMLYQTIKSGSGATANLGATSSVQVGLGAQMASIYTNITTQGSAKITGNALDLMITGDSFFIIENEGINNFSRDGSFTIDEQGFLVTQSNGYYVLGVMGDGGVPDGAAVGRLQVINRQEVTDEEGNVRMVDTMPGQATSEAYFKGNIDSQDKFLQPGEEGRVQRIEVYGNDGKKYTLKFTLSHMEEDESNVFNMSLDGITNENGDPLDIGGAQNIKLVYDKANGKLTSAGGNESGDFVYSFTGEASEVGPLTVNFSHTTNYAGTTTHASLLNVYRGNEQGLNKGYPEGELTGVSFGTDGSIFGTYSNGQTIKKGQIAVAEFSNAMGLEKVGDNLYAASLNSGVAQVMDITRDGGYMTSGVLEGSNVDLAKEFTDMITTQRGFQANSKVITTSDEMLQILKGLKR